MPDGFNSGVIPLAVLCSGLVVGGIAAIYITRKIARMRVLRQILLAQQEALAQELLLNTKPTLTDVYIGPPPELPDGAYINDVPWGQLQLRHTEVAISCEK